MARIVERYAQPVLMCGSTKLAPTPASDRCTPLLRSAFGAFRPDLKQRDAAE
jgi:hypothetical protein